MKDAQKAKRAKWEYESESDDGEDLGGDIDQADLDAEAEGELGEATEEGGEKKAKAGEGEKEGGDKGEKGDKKAGDKEGGGEKKAGDKKAKD